MEKSDKTFQPDRVLSYFKKEWKVLLIVTISGLIYNLGLLAGPWFEGKMTGCLVEILRGLGQFSDMLVLVLGYVTAIAVVQIARYIKRFYVRRFANNVNRRMKEILYAGLVRKSRASLREEGEGSIPAGTALHDFPANFLYDGGKDEKDDSEDRGCIQRAVRISEQCHFGQGRKCHYIPCSWMRTGAAACLRREPHFL